jgi:hypothetical protein
LLNPGIYALSGNEALHDALDRQTNPSTLSKVFAIKELGSLAVIGLSNGLCVTRLKTSAFVPALALDRLRKHPGKD